MLSLSIDKASSGDTTLLAAAPGKYIVVKGLLLVAAAATSVKLKSGSTDLSGLMYLNEGGSIVLPPSPEPWFPLGDQEALVLNQSAAVQISGRLYYDYVPIGS